MPLKVVESSIAINIKQYLGLIIKNDISREMSLQLFDHDIDNLKHWVSNDSINTVNIDMKILLMNFDKICII